MLNFNFREKNQYEILFNFIQFKEAVLSLTTTQAHFCFKTKSIKPKQMLILSILIYLYTPMFIICLYKKPQTHFRVCVYPHVSGNQPCNQSMILQQLIHVCSFYDSLFGERENKKKQLQAIIIILMGKLVLSNWISSVGGSIDVSLKDCSCSRHPCIL